MTGRKQSVPTRTSEVLRLARDLGWEMRPCRDGWFLRHPNGATTTLHGHGNRVSDKRSWKNAVARLRRLAAAR